MSDSTQTPNSSGNVNEQTGEQASRAKGPGPKARKPRPRRAAAAPRARQPRQPRRTKEMREAEADAAAAQVATPPAEPEAGFSIQSELPAAEPDRVAAQTGLAPAQAEVIAESAETTEATFAQPAAEGAVADAGPDIPVGPAPEPFEEDEDLDPAALADADWDEEYGLVTKEVAERVQDPEAPLTTALEPTGHPQPGIPGQPEEPRGRRRRRRRGRGRRGRAGAAGAEGAPPAGVVGAGASGGGIPAPAPVTAGALASAEAAESAGESTVETVAGIQTAAIGEALDEAETSVAARPAQPGEAPAGRRGRRRRRGRGRGRDGDRPGEPPATETVDVAEGIVIGEPLDEEQAEAAEEEEIAEVTPGKIMLVNIAQSDECRIAMLEEGKLQEFYIERTAALSHVGNIYKGVVTNIEPSIQAAFIDFGQGKNGFLHISDLQPQYFPGGGEAEDVGRKTPRKERPPMQKCLRRGQEIVVQVTKEGIGTKGATLTTYVALPGRYLVMMPGMSRLGVSRKIEDEDARRRMRDVLNQLELPRDMGFILRTAGLDRNKRDLQRDLNYLVRLWKQIQKRKNSIKAPAELYQESDLVTRTLRDVVTTDVEQILIDSEPVAESARQFLRLLSPRLAERVKYYSDAEPLFFKYGVEDELAKIYSKRVPLPSGGSLVIESTEALVAIDVNSGKFREAPDPEESAFRINLEAAEEIARQLSLRDLGGVIICDFIDMHMERHRREIERALRDALKKHKERAEILRMSRFGIIEMTRQRQRASIIRSMLIDCPHCGGAGMIKSAETIMLEALRAIQTAANHKDVTRIEVRLDNHVAQMLLNSKRRILAELETKNNKSIVVLPSTDAAANKISITCYDSRGWPVQVPLPKALMGSQ